MYMTGTDGIAFDAYAYDEFGRNLGNKIYENNAWMEICLTIGIVEKTKKSLYYSYKLYLQPC